MRTKWLLAMNPTAACMLEMIVMQNNVERKIFGYLLFRKRLGSITSVVEF